MVAPHEAEINLDAYARLTVALARAGAKRADILAAHHLNESRWQSIDDLWQARLSDAMEAGTDEVPIPPFLEQYSRAMDRAQSADSLVIPLERFADATRAVRRGGDIAQTLERLGLTYDDYLRANHYWMQRMAQDEDLAETFRRALG